VGSGRLAGAAAWLVWGGLLLVTACAVSAFGSFAGALAGGWNHLLGAGLLIVLVAGGWVGLALPRLLRALVAAVSLGALAVVGAATIPHLDRGLLVPDAYPAAGAVVAGAALTAFGYLAFLGGESGRPVSVTAGLYVVVAVAVCGTLTARQIGRHEATAVAEAVRPSFGDAGFAVVAVAALLATAVAAGAALNASVVLARSFVEAQLFPVFLAGRQVAVGLGAAIVFLLASAFGLATLVTIGAGVALTVFVAGAVAAGATRRRLVAAVAACAVLAFFVVDAWHDAPDALTATILVVALAFVLDYWMSVQDPRDDAFAATG
jgi:hypothetical protein